MPAPNPFAKYQDVNLSTVNQGKLLLKVYDAAISFVREAKSRMETKDYSGRGLYIDRAFGAINELRITLNFEHNPKLADSLNQLYFFMTRQLSQASLKNDAKLLDDVIVLLSQLRNVWDEAVKKENGKPRQPANMTA
ncbi:flagellar export chaperone FliS [bacterium]|nr:flagellar export chaperone FliS [bacterium]